MGRKKHTAGAGTGMPIFAPQLRIGLRRLPPSPQPGKMAPADCLRTEPGLFFQVPELMPRAIYKFLLSWHGNFEGWEHPQRRNLIDEFYLFKQALSAPEIENVRLYAYGKLTKALYRLL